MVPTIIIVLVIAALVVLDIRYIARKKKQGGCIGCSESGCGCSCGCGSSSCSSSKAGK